MKKTILFAIIVLLGFTSSCNKEEDEPILIEGSVTFDFDIDPGAFYIFLDTDGDPSNGVINYGTVTLTGNEAGVNYNWDTEDLVDGSYYLYAGFDLESDTNMNPFDMQVWEGLGWYGNTEDASMPALPPVIETSGTYDFTIFSLIK